MIEQITLEVIEGDLIKIIPERKDDIYRYFNILKLLKTVNTLEEYHMIKKDLKKIRGIKK